MAGSKEQLGSTRFLEDGSKIDFDALLSNGWQQVGGELTKLEEAQAVRGIYRDVSTFETDGKKLNVYTVETKGGACRLLGVTMLDHFFSKVKIGQNVIIRRNKDRKSSKGRTVQDYTTVAEPIRNANAA